MKWYSIFLGISIGIFWYTYQEYTLVQYPMDKISFLTVGQGDASFIQSKRGDRVLIDCGPNDNVLDQLQAKIGFWSRNIDIIIITHGDTDHFGGCIDIINHYQVSKVMINGVFDSKNETYITLLKTIKDRGIQILPAIADTYISLGDSIELQLLHPQTNLWGQDIRDDNGESVVILLKSINHQILLTGDADAKAEEKIITRYPHLDIDILKAGHHGSKTSTSDIFLDAITPKQVIISAGLDNRYNHPHPETIKKLQDRKIDIIEVKKFMTGFDILL